MEVNVVYLHACKQVQKKRQDEWWLNPHLNLVSHYYDAKKKKELQKKKKKIASI